MGVPAVARALAALALIWPTAALAIPADRGVQGDGWRSFEDSIRAAEEAWQSGDLGRAETEYRRAIDRSRSYGPRNLRLGRALDGLADLYHASQRLEEAEALYLQSLDIWKELLGEEQPRVAITLHNLAALYLARGDMQRAEPLFRRSLEIWEKTLGTESLEVALSLEANAALLQHQGRWDEAQDLLERARAIRGRVAGDGR